MRTARHGCGPLVPVNAMFVDEGNYDLPCRYGLCADTYDRASNRIWGGFGPVSCPHEVRGGLRGHGTWAEQFAPHPAYKPSRHKPGWRRKP